MLYAAFAAALLALRGHLVAPADQPRLHGTVGRLCATADMPKPALAVSETDLPDAFATGRDPTPATPCCA